MDDHAHIRWISFKQRTCVPTTFTYPTASEFAEPDHQNQVTTLQWVLNTHVCPVVGNAKRVFIVECIVWNSFPQNDKGTAFFQFFEPTRSGRVIIHYLAKSDTRVIMELESKEKSIRRTKLKAHPYLPETPVNVSNYKANNFICGKRIDNRITTKRSM